MAIPHPDIERISTEDARMRAVLKYKEMFFYKDWQDFRQKDFRAILGRLSRRARRTTFFMIAAGSIFLVAKIGAILWETGGSMAGMSRPEWFDLGIGLLYGGSMLGFGLFLRRQARDMDELKTELESMDPTS